MALLQVNRQLYPSKQTLLNLFSLLNVISYSSGAEERCVDEHGTVHLMDALLFLSVWCMHSSAHLVNKDPSQS